MSEFKDHFSGHAQGYAAARPSYPPALFEWLAALVNAREQAWDAGCGNGQASRQLAGYFRQVLATDASEKQIEQAQPHPGVTFAVAPAETCPLSAGSCDLVTAAQAAHWFEHERFHGEVARVLKPGGVVALWCYGINVISPAIDRHVEHLYRDILEPDWPPERALIEDGYRSLPFPFPEFRAPDFALEAHWTADQYLAYLRSWSATQRHRQRTGKDPVAAIEDALRREWGEARRTVHWPLHFRVGSRP